MELTTPASPAHLLLSLRPPSPHNISIDLALGSARNGGSLVVEVVAGIIGQVRLVGVKEPGGVRAAAVVVATQS